VRGPKPRLNAASAQGIGLALHELITNPGKYGALSNDTSRLDLGWGTGGETFRMRVERDGPLVSPPLRRGFVPGAERKRILIPDDSDRSCCSGDLSAIKS
jgi:two-component sensor histidine kinase